MPLNVVLREAPLEHESPPRGLQAPELPEKGGGVFGDVRKLVENGSAFERQKLGHVAKRVFRAVVEHTVRDLSGWLVALQSALERAH